MTHTITVYSKPQCVQCTQTKFVLDRAEKEYDTFDLTEDPSAMETVKNFGYLAAPVVVAKDSDGAVVNHWSGFRPDLIEKYV